MKTIRIGSRDSKLAIIQTQIVANAIKEYDDSINIEIVTMKTTGDKILNVTLDKIGGKGLFVKELDEALLSGAVDITVHSFKDMPMDINPELPIAAMSKREDPRDVLICRKDSGVLISRQSIIGCSSKRRSVQLQQMGFENIHPLRGNVQTRLRKLNSGEYDAIVLAAAGIKRLGLESIIDKYFTIDEILPAACQGVLAVQTRKGENTEYLSRFHDKEAEIAATAERAFVKALDGGCSSPTAAYAALNGDEVEVTGFFVDEAQIIYKDTIKGHFSEAENLGVLLANKIKELII